MTMFGSVKTSRRRVLAGGATSLMLLGATGCGYILYPERRGRVVVRASEDAIATVQVGELI
jgi:hypothetical protein